MKREVPRGWNRKWIAVVAMTLAAVILPAAKAAPFPTRCVQDRGPLSDFLDYSLYVTAPTTGYHFKLVGTTVKGDVVRIAVRQRLDRGVHAQVLQTHRLRFTIIAPPFPTRYTAVINGRKPGPPKPIVVPRTK